MHADSPAQAGDTAKDRNLRLFRAGGVERLTSPDRLDLAAHVVRSPVWILLLVASLVTVTAVVASIVIRVPVKIGAEGMLLSIDGLRDLSAPAAGPIDRIDVRMGDRIQVGQPVARIAQPDLQQLVQAAQAELKDAAEQLAQTAAFQDRVRQARDAALAEQRLSGTKGRMDELDAKAGQSQAAEEAARVRQALRKLELEESATRSQEDRERLALSLKVGAAERHVAELEDRFTRASIVVSPYEGTVAELKVNPGELVERGAALLTVVPSARSDAGTAPPLVATLYVPPSDGKKIKPGMAVELVPAMVKREEYGFIVARVTSVAEVPSSREGMLRALKNPQTVEKLAAGGAPYELRAELEPADTATGLRWSSSSGPGSRLTGGSPCKAAVVTKSTPLITVLMPVMGKLFPSESGS